MPAEKSTVKSFNSANGISSSNVALAPDGLLQPLDNALSLPHLSAGLISVMTYRPFVSFSSTKVTD